MDSTKMMIPAIRETILGVKVYRGFAPLCELARISRADIYDQIKNPRGTQRDLSPKHARDAYEYVKLNDLAYWPEIFLCARDSSVLKFGSGGHGTSFGILTIQSRKAINSRKILISRVDGNHRLHYADGSHDGFPPIEKLVSFSIAYKLTGDEEIRLFRDINNNQRRMNTSHLDNIKIRLTKNEILKREEPDLYIAEKLAREANSPFYGIVFEGGKKIPGTVIPLRSLRIGIGYMLSRPTKLNALEGADAQYRVIRNFFKAVKEWAPEAWANPKGYLLLRGAGLWGVCFIGQEVIDRALGKGNFDSKEMLSVLNSGRQFDWSNSGEFKGYSGRGGAVRISESVVSEFTDESGISMKQLYRRIMEH